MTPEGGDALTYVTVVCRRDLAFLELQVRSMALFGASDGHIRCLVIANDADGALVGEAEALISRVPTASGLRYEVVPCSAVVPELDVAWGWRSQQILKLEVHRLVSTDWYVVLDAKNHFLRPFSVRDFVQEDGRGRIALQRHRGHMEPYLRASLQEFGLEADGYLERGFPTTTPLPLHTRTVSLLSGHLRAEGRGSINDHLEEKAAQGVTEFFTYYGFLLLSQGGKLEELYSVGSGENFVLFADVLSFEPRWAALMERVLRPEALSFGLHWGAALKLSAVQALDIAAMWTRKGLLSSEDGMALLARMKSDVEAIAP